MGIGPGAWVGLMLGNVPDFVILALALSKLGRRGGAARSDHRQPRAGDDPGGGAAARAHHPAARRRGRTGGGRAPLLREPAHGARPPRRATVEVRAREPAAAAGHAAHLQPLQARADRQPGRSGRGRRRSCSSPPTRRRRSQGRACAPTRTSTPRRRRSASAGRARRGSRALRGAAPPQLRLRLRPAAGAGRTARRCSSRTRCRPSASPSCCASRDRRLPRHARALRRAGAGADGQAAQGERRALPELGLAAARPRSPSASTSGTASACSPATTAPRRGRSRSIAAARIPTTVGKPFEGVELRVGRPDGERAAGRRGGPDLGARGGAVDASAVPKIHLARSATAASRSAASTAGLVPHRRPRASRQGAGG